MWSYLSSQHSTFLALRVLSQTDIENVWTPRGESGWGGGVGGSGMNWEIGIDMYTLICVKQITNKNLLYKKVNKIKFKKKKSTESDWSQTYSPGSLYFFEWH